MTQNTNLDKKSFDETRPLGITLSEAIEQYIYASEVEGKSDSTIDLYQYVFEGFLDFLGGDTSLKSVTTDRVRAFIKTLMDGDYTPNTVAIHHRVLQAFFNWLVEEELLEKAPTENISEPKTPNKFPRVLTKEQTERLIEVAGKRKQKWAGFRNYTIIICFLDMGLRLNELTGAKVENLNMKERTLKVHGKGGKDRVVFFGFETYKTLRKWLSMRKKKSDPVEETIFITQNGDRLKHRYVQRIVTRMQRRANLENTKVSPHVLRHTAATLAVKNGMEPFALKRYFGWEKMETAMRYVHMNNETVRASFREASPIDNLERSE